MKNILGSEMKQVPFNEFIEGVAQQEGFVKLLKEDGAEGLVKFEGLNITANPQNKGDIGMMTIVAFGSRHPFFPLEKLASGRLGDTPSQFQYPTQWCKRP